MKQVRYIDLKLEMLQARQADAMLIAGKETIRKWKGQGDKAVAVYDVPTK
jgi:hypothetical protein